MYLLFIILAITGVFVSGGLIPIGTIGISAPPPRSPAGPEAAAPARWNLPALRRKLLLRAESHERAWASAARLDCGASESMRRAAHERCAAHARHPLPGGMRQPETNTQPARPARSCDRTEPATDTRAATA